MPAVGKGDRRRRLGRPAGPPERARRNRVAIMVTDAELAKLDRIANALDVPLGTMAHRLLAESLRRRRL